MNQLNLSSYKGKVNGDTLNASEWNNMLTAVENATNQVLGDKIGPIDTTAEYNGIRITTDNNGDVYFDTRTYTVTKVSSYSGTPRYAQAPRSTITTTAILNFDRLADQLGKTGVTEKLDLYRDLSELTAGEKLYYADVDNNTYSIEKTATVEEESTSDAPCMYISSGADLVLAAAELMSIHSPEIKVTVGTGSNRPTVDMADVIKLVNYFKTNQPSIFE